MSRIKKKFADLAKKKEKALILYMTAGDPSLKKNAELIYAFEKEGVDFIELGVPFSDPLADGPVIQAASQRALERKIDLTKILALVKKVRNKTQIPLLLMSYLNPILHFGVERFLKFARTAGIDGIIIPDLPPDEGKEIASLMRSSNIDLVYLLAPTSTAERVRMIAKSSRGFIYYVSITGVTGIKQSLPAELARNVRAAKHETKLPVCVGFGVSTPEQAAIIAKSSDGVIVGSAIVKALSAHPAMNAEQFSKKFVRPFVKAMKKGR